MRLQSLLFISVMPCVSSRDKEGTPGTDADSEGVLADDDCADNGDTHTAIATNEADHVIPRLGLRVARMAP